MSRIFASYDPNCPMQWRLEQRFARQTSIGVVAIEAGFCWDGPSVPRFLRCIMPVWVPYSEAALIHDALYTWRTSPRATADRVFREVLLENGLNPRRVWIAWLSIRLFGRRHWR